MSNSFVLNRYKVPNILAKCSTDQYFQVGERLLITDFTTYRMNKFAYIRALRDVGITLDKLFFHTDKSFNKLFSRFHRGTDRASICLRLTFARNFNE